MRIVSRAEWGADPRATPAAWIATPTPELWLHHTASTGLHGAAGMRSLQSNAIAGDYSDIPYSYVVDTDGLIFEARGAARNSAATADHNERSHAVCAFGNFELEQPSDELLTGIVDIARWLHEHGHTASAEFSGGHRDVYATACPGANLYARIPDINARIRGGSSSSSPSAPANEQGGAMEICGTPSGKGYWIVDSTGAVFAYGDAKYYGGANELGLDAPIRSMAATPTGRGYWLLGADGGVFAYGDAPFIDAPVGMVH